MDDLDHCIATGTKVSLATAPAPSKEGLRSKIKSDIQLGSVEEDKQKRDDSRTGNSQLSIQ